MMVSAQIKSYTCLKTNLIFKKNPIVRTPGIIKKLRFKQRFVFK